jgi:hypothetical protein
MGGAVNQLATHHHGHSPTEDEASLLRGEHVERHDTSRRCAPNAMLNKRPPPSISLQLPAGWAWSSGDGVALLGTAYGATLAAGLLSLQSPEQPIRDAFFSALEVLI